MTTIMIISVLFAVVSLSGSACWYAKRQNTTLKATFLLLFQECIVGGFLDTLAKARSVVKAVPAYVKRVASYIADCLRPEPVKHLYSPDLYYGLWAAVSGYVCPAFQPIIDMRYTPAPSYVYISLYTKAAITEEVTAEIVWAVTAKFREYLGAYGLCFSYQAIPYVQANHIEVYLYYCEYPAEASAYQAQLGRAMLMVAEPGFKPLTEADVPDVVGFTLGYSLDKWRSSGQVAPIRWDIAEAPHMMISGPTGGGKTVYVKLLLAQLLNAGAAVTICDFKGHNDLRGIVKDFAAGAECDACLSRFCADFERAREQGGATERKHVLIFDEFGSFATTKSKKDFDDLMREISNIIFMGRSYGYSIILTAQRFDAETIRTSLREQFGIKVYMGPSISQQSATMLFPNSDLDKSSRLPPCCGYFSTPKVNLDTLTVPKVDIPTLDHRLKILGNHPGG